MLTRALWLEPGLELGLGQVQQQQQQHQQLRQKPQLAVRAHAATRPETAPAQLLEM